MIGCPSCSSGHLDLTLMSRTFPSYLPVKKLKPVWSAILATRLSDYVHMNYINAQQSFLSDFLTHSLFIHQFGKRKTRLDNITWQITVNLVFGVLTFYSESEPCWMRSRQLISQVININKSQLTIVNRGRCEYTSSYDHVVSLKYVDRWYLYIL